ncbi:ABC transporter substrate-binding protein [Jiangella rhizosphaerae]|uniref:Sugar ABC transporter substrate-binding protein n=1 Tax=Jiangella rhizosphaerae TaxID=2293569 RepID=A0A418KUK5_9ACTN|nr:sugar ABC transporter substrate-binding protein [Jiangella rhizosphaerae]RIQ31015.1 sugar ABC transporter substrate-binding protein [Jiangella rhizosphaerae]
MRTPRVLAVAVPVAALLAACGGGDTTGGDGDVVELRYAFWGSDDRAQMTQEMIDAFEAENPDIRVEIDYADFGAYFDKLATSVAAGDAPDIMTMGGAYHSEYAGRGALLDLGEVDDIIRTDDIGDDILAHGTIDGSLYAIPTGVNGYAMVANPAVFAAAGLELPDDTTWTWDDFAQLCTQIGTALGEEGYGAQDLTNHNTLALWARQHGEQLYTEDGELGLSAGTLTEWWEFSLELRDSGCTPPATRTEELASQSAPEQTLIGTNTGGMALVWSNVLEALSTASGEELRLLIPPGVEGGEPGSWLGPSMYYTISARTEHPEEAARLVDFMLNEPAAAESFLTDRGLPVNTEVRDAIVPQLTPVQQAEAEYLDRLQEVVGEPVPPAPVGSTETAGIVTRLNSEVLFDRMTPGGAAEQALAEIGTALDR